MRRRSGKVLLTPQRTLNAGIVENPQRSSANSRRHFRSPTAVTCLLADCGGVGRDYPGRSRNSRRPARSFVARRRSKETGQSLSGNFAVRWNGTSLGDAYASTAAVIRYRRTDADRACDRTRRQRTGRSGFSTDLAPSMTLGCSSNRARNVTSDRLSPHQWWLQKRVAFETKPVSRTSRRYVSPLSTAGIDGDFAEDRRLAKTSRRSRRVLKTKTRGNSGSDAETQAPAAAQPSATNGVTTVVHDITPEKRGPEACADQNLSIS